MKNKNYSFSQKFFEGEALSGFWSLVLYGVVSLNSFIIIYFISVYEYGLYQLIISVVAAAESLTAGFLDMLFVTDFSRYIGLGENRLAKRIFSEFIFFKLVLAGMLVVLILSGANIISHYYGQNIALFLRIASIALFFKVAVSAMNSFFDGNIYFNALASPVFGEIVKLFSP